MADPTLKINGKEYPLILPNDFTLGEDAEAERITGQGYDWDGKVGGLGLLAAAYISVRRVDPTVKLSDIEMLKGSDIELDVPEGDALPPEPSAGSSASGNSSSPSGDTTSESSPAVSTPDVSGAPV